MKNKNCRICIVILIFFGILSVQSQSSENSKLTANDVMNRIKQATQCEWSDKTVDTFKSGCGDMKVTGIITTFTATCEVLNKAREMGCNFILTHEPTYYNHLDETSDLEGDQVFEQKRQFIEDNGMIVMRFHDYWHRMTPDGIYVGMISELGWKNNRVGGENQVFNFKKMKLKKFVKQLKSIYPQAEMRIIGDPNMMMTTVGLSVGASGFRSHIRLLTREDVDVLVAGEAREWETVEYVRDAMQQGKNKACVLLGHAISEEAGMEYCTQWLKKFITEVPIHFIPAGDPFWSL